MGHSHHHDAPVGNARSEEVYSPELQRLLRWVTIVSVSIASMLVVSKIFAWLYTDSLSLLSSLVDSSMDVMVSLVNFVAIRYALKPADDDHRYGHNSIEDIAGLVQFTFISATSAFVIIQSIGRILAPEPLAHTDMGVAVMIFSMVATTVLLLFQRYVYKRTQSSLVAADALHYLGDVLSNGAVIAALILTPLLGWLWIDPALAIIFSLYIALHAIEIGKRSFDNLMDKEMPDSDKARIMEIIRDCEGVQGFHDLKTRYSGSKAFIQMHADMDGSQTLNDAHKVADALEAALIEAFPGADVIIHEDPVN